MSSVSSVSSGLSDLMSDVDMEIPDVEAVLSNAKKKYTRVQVKAVRRLFKDLHEIRNHPVPFVHAEPIDNNLFLWHGNLSGPSQTPFEGGVFHIVIEVPFNYPDSPPVIQLSNEIPHPFVNGKDISLSLLTEEGWSPVYSIQTLLLQLQSFLLDGLAASHIDTGHSVTFTQRQTSSWMQVFEEKDTSGEGTLKPEDIRDLMLEVGERKPSVAELAIFYRMLFKPASMAIDFSTFLRILQKKREYRKVVETANRFYCPHPKCKHRPQFPFPPFPSVQEKDFVAKKPAAEIFLEETKCFYSKDSILAPDNATLGVGISFTRDVRDGSISSVSSPLDFLSLSSFRKQEVKKSADNQSIVTHWLPLYINEEHGKRAMHLAPRCLGIICRGSHREFKAEFVLKVLPKLMNNLILQVVKGKEHASVRAVDGYVAFHRLFIALVDQYPELRVQIKQMVDTFVNDPSKRTKAHIPNLGDFLCMISVLEEVDIPSVMQAYVDEMLVRDVRWLLSTQPQLGATLPDPKIDRHRASLTFAASFSSYSLLLFHKHFLELARSMPQEKLKAVYDSRHGRGTDEMVNNLIVEFKTIKHMKTYDEFSRRLGLDPPEDIVSLLRGAVVESDRRNYHGKRVIQVKSADEFLKEKLKNFRTLASMADEKRSSKASLAEQKKAKSNVAPKEEELPILIEDEALWRTMCEERFGVKDLEEPDANLHEEANPWRQLYLQLNVQEMLGTFNENPDFQAFYEALHLSGRHLRVIVYTVSPVTNIKSNYHFLTALLTRLIHLEKLVILKGESTLGMKGCKALCKGLINNPNSLRILDLHYTHFVAACVELLEEGLLASKSLVILNLEGNPIKDVGASSIAKVLKEHSNISELNIASCMIGCAGAMSLASAFYYNKSLRKLSIGKNSFTPAGFAQILDKLAYSQTIKQLDCARLSDNGAVAPAQMASITRLFEVNNSLEEVNFFCTSLKTLSEEVIHGLGQNRSLKRIDLAFSELRWWSGESMKKLGWAIAKNKSIVELHLDGNVNDPAKMIAFFAAVYDAEDEIALRRAAETFRKLTDAELEEDLRPRGCNLETLTLNQSNIKLTTEREEKILKRFVSLSTSLVTLDLSQCQIGFQASCAIGAGLEGHPTLKDLNLAKNTLGEHGIKKLCLGLAKNTVLEKLNIAFNGVGGRGASSVANLLKVKTSNLKNVVLYGNFVGIEGARFIASALTVNSRLVELDIGLNRIRVKGTAAISGALASNSTLEVIRLKYNFINDSSASDFVKTILANKESAVKKVALAGNRVKRAILVQCMRLLAERSIDLDVAELLQVTQSMRMRNTAYCTPLPKDVTGSSLKKVFYDGGCGAIVNVSIFAHKKRSTYDKAMYAFVEFAEPSSVDLALDLGMEKKTVLSGKKVFRVLQAGTKTITKKRK